ncbi:hypothetical protein P3T23_002192 [Paraburkholderia sp. GAS448]
MVERSAIRKYMGDKWTHLCQRPSRIIRALGVAPNSLEELEETLLAELELLDEEHGGKNNWDSVFSPFSTAGSRCGFVKRVSNNRRLLKLATCFTRLWVQNMWRTRSEKRGYWWRKPRVASDAVQQRGRIR